MDRTGTHKVLKRLEGQNREMREIDTIVLGSFPKVLLPGLFNVKQISGCK